MTETNHKTIGLSLVGLSVFLMLALVVVKIDIDGRDTALCEVYHLNPDLELEQCPAHQSNTSWFVVGSFSIAFLVLGSGAYLFFEVGNRLNKTEKFKFKETDTTKLNADEKIVYDFLKLGNGSSYQSDIRKETGFSKVKITRILDKLEASEIIERKRRGMTNLVVLK
jgi:uncharacterized membrane protein